MVRRWGIVICALACSGPPPAPPSAVINITPASVCVGDDMRTKVHLSSNGSSPELTLVYGAPPPDAGTLNFFWSFSGAVCKGLTTDPSPCDVTITGKVEPDGTLDYADEDLVMMGDKPVFVSLTSTIMLPDGTTGGSTTSQAVIPITPLDDAGACPLLQGP
jgi:hypothetical protein